jgi:hypothetical protein
MTTVNGKATTPKPPLERTTFEFFGHVGAAERGGRDLTLRDLVRQFRGLSGTAKAKPVCDQFPEVKRLADFVDREAEVGRLLTAMRDESQPPSPGVLGQVGEDHFRRRFERWYGVRRWWYKKVAGDVDGVPYVIEVALAETTKPGGLFTGVNFSPTFDDPLAGNWLQGPEFSAGGVVGFLEHGHVNPERPRRTAAAFHLVCPVLETLDKGKSRLKVPAAIVEAAAKALWSVVKQLYREEERRRKDAARQERADRGRERAAERAEAPEWDLVRAAFEVIPQAVRDAAGGLGRVSAHTLYYHVRPLVQQHTSRELTSKYFEQNLLPRYQLEVAPIPELYYEPRGVLYEPHTGEAVPLGTREVEEYEFPSWLYDKILFVEKQGLWPVFEAARLAEQYDMAIVAGEGFATEACRVLFASGQRDKDYQIFVLHDADPWGYNIARTLREETARMPEHRIEVIDLGLRLEAALALGLPEEQFTRKKALPQGLALNDRERESFEGRKVVPKSWVCRRVELNAFTNPALVGYVESGLRDNGVRGKVIPTEALLSEFLRSDVRMHVKGRVEKALEPYLNAEVDRLMQDLEPAIGAGQQGLRDAVAAELSSQPRLRWSVPLSIRADAIASQATPRKPRRRARKRK